MKNLIIIGASGFGREVLTWAQDNWAYGRDWVVKGFLDDRAGILGGFARDANALPGAVPAAAEVRDRYRRDLPVLGSPFDYVPQPDDVFLCAVGDPEPRKRYATPVLEKGGRFGYLQHPTAAVSVFARLGQGCIVGPFTSISPDVSVGDFVTINSYTALAHDVTVGAWTEIDGHCMIGGRARIGERVRIHAGAIVTPDATIGDGAVVGAGSVVIGRIPPGVTVVGNPARRFDWQAR